MLALRENEREIVTVSLKKNQTMEVTNLKLSVHNSSQILSTIPVQDIRSITPVSKGEIRIQFQMPKKTPNGNKKYERKHYDIHIDKNEELTSIQVCNKIIKEHQRLNTWSKNEFGYFIMQPHENIVSAYRNIKTSKGIGILYVTNLGVSLETHDGVTFDVKYNDILLVTGHKKNRVRLVWMEPWNSLTQHKFDFEMNEDIDKKTVRLVIQEQFSKYRSDTGYDFIQLEKQLGNLSYDEYFNLISSGNPKFREYLDKHVEHTFGSYVPLFGDSDWGDIRVCKLLGLDVDVISKVSSEEMVHRKEAVVLFEHDRQYNKKYNELKEQRETLEKRCDTKEEFVTMQKSVEYEDLIKKISDHEKTKDPDFEDKRDIVVANYLKAGDKRIQIMYNEWQKQITLPEFSDDEYSDGWKNCLMDKLNNTHGKIELFGSTMKSTTLKELMKDSDRNRTTLNSFVKPDGISEDDIYNNCWYDKERKMWYVYDDNLEEVLKNEAVSDLEHSQATINRRVWGFAGEQVEIFGGVPAICLYSCYEQDINVRVSTSRITGKRQMYVERAYKFFSLPILKEENITRGLLDDIGSIYYKTEEMKYSIDGDGGRKWMTPKMHEMYIKKYNLDTVPLKERVKRAIFASKTGGFFNNITSEILEYEENKKKDDTEQVLLT